MACKTPAGPGVGVGDGDGVGVGVVGDGEGPRHLVVGVARGDRERRSAEESRPGREDGGGPDELVDGGLGEVEADRGGVNEQVGRFVADAEAIYSYEGTREINTLIVGRALTGIGAFV